MADISNPANKSWLEHIASLFSFISALSSSSNPSYFSTFTNTGSGGQGKATMYMAICSKKAGFSIFTY